MKQTIVLSFCILMLLPILGEAQSTPLGKYTFTFQPLQLLFQEVPFTVERTVKRNTFGLLLAYRFQTNWDQNPNGPYYNFNNEWSRTQYSVSDYRSYTVGFNFKHYLKKKNKVYCEAQLFYRHWWEDNAYDVNYAGIEKVYVTDVTHVFGAKFLVGHTSVLPKKGSVRLILHKYAGISLRERVNGSYEHSIYAPGVVYNFRNNTTPGEEGLKFGIQMGIALGFSVYPKTSGPK